MSIPGIYISTFLLYDKLYTQLLLHLVHWFIFLYPQRHCFACVFSGEIKLSINQSNHSNQSTSQPINRPMNQPRLCKPQFCNTCFCNGYCCGRCRCCCCGYWLRKLRQFSTPPLEFLSFSLKPRVVVVLWSCCGRFCTFPNCLVGARFFPELRWGASKRISTDNNHFPTANEKNISLNPSWHPCVDRCGSEAAC